MLTGFKLLFWHVNGYFTDQDLMKRGDPIQFNFEDFEIRHSNG